MSELHALPEAQLREAISDTILLTTHNGMDCGPNPTPINDVARMIVEDVLRPLLAERDEARAVVERVRAVLDSNQYGRALGLQLVDARRALDGAP